MLPKIATPKYDMIVPSTGKTITYRPYLVREEKILLISMEANDNIAIENAVLDIIKACVETSINVNKLATFDVEFIFSHHSELFYSIPFFWANTNTKDLLSKKNPAPLLRY